MSVFLWSTQQRKNKEDIQKKKLQKHASGKKTSKQENREEIFPFLYKSYTELKNKKKKRTKKCEKETKINLVSKADLEGIKKWKTKWQDISTQIRVKTGWNMRKQKKTKKNGKHVENIEKRRKRNR